MAKMIFVTLVLLSLFAKAEYRAFELRITNSTTGKSYSVRSTFDHIQYRQYYTVTNDETVEIVETWMCRGRTEYFKPICQSPSPDRGQASVPNQDKP